MLVAGYATNLFDSISGEGISFALLYGKIAAKAIDYHFQNPFE